MITKMKMFPRPPAFQLFAQSSYDNIQKKPTTPSNMMKGRRFLSTEVVLTDLNLLYSLLSELILVTSDLISHLLHFFPSDSLRGELSVFSVSPLPPSVRPIHDLT